MRGKRGSMPDGLNAATIKSWQQGTAKTTRTDHLRWILEAYAKYKSDLDRIPLTKDIIESLRREKLRTRISPGKFLQYSEQELPEGLQPYTIENWIYGRVKNVDKLHLIFVISEYKSHTDAQSRIETTPSNGRHNNDLRVSIEGSPLSKLEDEISRTDRGVTDILRLAKKPLPVGLTR